MDTSAVIVEIDPGAAEQSQEEQSDLERDYSAAALQMLRSAQRGATAYQDNYAGVGQLEHKSDDPFTHNDSFKEGTSSQRPWSSQSHMPEKLRCSLLLKARQSYLPSLPHLASFSFRS